MPELAVLFANVSLTTPNDFTTFLLSSLVPDNGV